MPRRDPARPTMAVNSMGPTFSARETSDKLVPSMIVNTSCTASSRIGSHCSWRERPATAAPAVMALFPESARRDLSTVRPRTACEGLRGRSSKEHRSHSTCCPRSRSSWRSLPRPEPGFWPYPVFHRQGVRGLYIRDDPQPLTEAGLDQSCVPHPVLTFRGPETPWELFQGLRNPLCLWV